MKFLQSALFGLLASLTTAQVFPCENTDLCLYSKQVDENIEFTITAPKDNGYVAFGFGESMASAEIYVAWLTEDGTPVVSRRTSEARRQPEPASDQDAEIVQDTTGIIQGQQVITFRRPLSPTPAGGLEASFTGNEASTNLIWAVHSSRKPNGQDITIHSARGIVRDGALFTPDAAFTLDKLGSNVAGGSGPSQRDTFVRVHGIVMVIAWLFMAPLGIAIARFFKEKLGKWWFRLHSAVFTLGVGGLTIIGFILVILALEDTPGVKHFSPSTYEDPVGGAHVVYGLIIVILMVVQILSGVVIDKLFDPTRTSTPIQDKVHWFLGRIVTLSGWINVILGIYIFGNLTGETVNVFYYIIIAWFVLVVALFAIAQRVLGQTHDNADKSHA